MWSALRVFFGKTWVLGAGLGREFMEVDEQFEAANRRAGEFQASHPRAVDARFDRRTGRIVIQLSSRMDISFSPRDAEGLQKATSTELELIEISPSGYGIHFPRLDADLHLPALLAGHLGSERWMAARQQLAPSHAEPSSKAEKTAALEPKLGKKEKWGGFRAIPGGLPASRPPKRGNTKIEKDRNHQGGHQKHSVIGSVGPTRTHSPKIWRKSDDGEKEEDPGNFEPNDSTNSAKGTQEAAHTAGYASAGLGCGTPRRPTRAPSTNLCVYSGLRRAPSSGLRASREPLSHDSSGDAHSDSQGPADGLWSHSVYDGNSDAG
jgi:hypothetical protein